jgi:hypothetical protein
MAEIDLAFIARQLERLVNDMAGLKDDMVVVMARLDRLDATTHSLVTQVRDAQPARPGGQAGRAPRGGEPGRPFLTAASGARPDAQEPFGLGLRIRLSLRPHTPSQTLLSPARGPCHHAAVTAE